MADGRFRRLAAPLGFFLLLLAEFLLFDQVGAKHHTWVYPRWNDQVQYLTEAYLAHETAREKGLEIAVKEALTNPSAQGTLHDAAAVILFHFTGPSRSAALSLNMLALCAWQAALFFVTWYRTRSWSLSFLLASGLLFLGSGWATAPGSAFDFRLDWFAVSGMGICLCAALYSKGFSSVHGSVVFGLCAGMVILTRFITAAYFVLIFAGCATACLRCAGRWTRIRNVVIAGLACAALAGPIIWLNREHLYVYYFVGHLTGPESGLRSLGLSIWQSAWWVLTHFFGSHVGVAFLFSAASVLLAFLVALVISPADPRKGGAVSAFERRPPLLIPAIFALSPLLVLSIHIQKTEQVLGVALAGFFGLIAALYERGHLAVSQTAQRRLAAAGVGVALLWFGYRMAEDPHPAEFKADARTAAYVADIIVNRTDEANLDHPRVAVDRIVDSLDAQILRVMVYERHRRWIPFAMTLPTGIYEEKTELYWERLNDSDFVVLTIEGDEGRWPYDRQMAQLRPETLAWADSKLRRIHEFTLAGQRMVLFERPYFR